MTSLESQARYITRPALAMDALHKLQDGNLALDTPPDPKTGATAVTLDPLEWIHRITAHIPDPGRHGQRFYGAYSNRARAAIARADVDNADAAANTYAQQNNSDFSREARSTWARLLRKIFEVDPLVCKHLRNFERPTRNSGQAANCRAFCRSEIDFGVIIPAYTHLQQAQPVLLAHYWLSFFFVLERERGRIAHAFATSDSCPLGAGAVAGCGTTGGAAGAV